MVAEVDIAAGVGVHPEHDLGGAALLQRVRLFLVFEWVKHSTDLIGQAGLWEGSCVPSREHRVQQEHVGEHGTVGHSRMAQR